MILSSKDRDIIDFRLFAKLNAFCVTVCDEKNNIAEIKIQGKSFHTVKNYLKDSFFFNIKEYTNGGRRAVKTV